MPRWCGHTASIGSLVVAGLSNGRTRSASIAKLGNRSGKSHVPVFEPFIRRVAWL